MMIQRLITIWWRCYYTITEGNSTGYTGNLIKWCLTLEEYKED